MNTIVLRRGRDGKDYPARPLTRQERARAIRLAHQLVHDHHLSVRVAQQVMADRYGIRRAVGSIAHDLEAFECQACAEPEHVTP